MNAFIFFIAKKAYVARKLNKIGYVRIYIVWKVNVMINSFRAVYILISGEMKTECIRIYIVVVARTVYIWLLAELIYKVINFCFR